MTDNSLLKVLTSRLSFASVKLPNYLRKKRTNDHGTTVELRHNK